jgi:wyosine [tRNA(Phe)-imidazoG37] synthetase (radical SAM superfamily)
MTKARVYGPVPSRRFGHSLGVDLIPAKTCTYNCIYCQLGRTTHCTIERMDYTDIDGIVDDIEHRLDANVDCITFSGCGEPTLHSRIGELICAVKQRTSRPVVVLTNGSLLWRDDVAAEVAAADIVVPSLDAGNESMYRAVNRPHPEIDFHRMMTGLVQFRRRYSGDLRLEVLLLENLTEREEEVKRIASWARLIQPDTIYLHTVSRPPAEEYAVAVPPARLSELAGLFMPRAELIQSAAAPAQTGTRVPARDEVIELLRRRPCTIDDIADGLDACRKEVVRIVVDLLNERVVEQAIYSSRLFLSAPGTRDRPPDTPVPRH